MSKSNTFENDWLLLVFNNTNISLVGDATGLRGSTTVGSLYVGTATADPGEAGTQSTSQSAYGGYARTAVARTSGGWTVTGNLAENTATVSLPQCTSGGPETETHFTVGTDSSGTGKLLYSGALGASLIVNPGIQPQFAAGAIDITED